MRAVSLPDDETTTAENQLRLALDSALGRKLELGRVTSVVEKPTLHGFTAAPPNPLERAGA